MLPTRRHFIASLTTCIGVSAASQILAATGEKSSQPQIATNTYPWLTFSRRDGNEFKIHSDSLLADIASAGINGYEPIINGTDEMNGLGERLQRHSLEMKSIYVNSVLHDPKQIEESCQSVIQIARRAAELGTTIVVTNPSPIRWGGDEDKTDAQLRLQAQSLDRLGAELRKFNVSLAYHNHDAELRKGAREFHHMLTATDPENVKFCLDAHWVFRGCGDSEIAVFDVLKNYMDRIVELHLRQSVGGIWTEAFAVEGDIDYARLFDQLSVHQISPRLVLEQAVENRSTDKLSAVDAHRSGRNNLNDVLV